MYTLSSLAAQICSQGASTLVGRNSKPSSVFTQTEEGGGGGGGRGGGGDGDGDL